MPRKSLSDPCARRVAVVTGLVLVSWIVLLYRLTGVQRFETADGPIWGIADDAYITADFARTFATGGGPRWYPGAPRVEGFTSPLWVVLLALLQRLPGFEEDRLGEYVFFLNALLLVVTAGLLGRALVTFLRGTDDGRVPPRWRFAVIVPLGAIATATCLYSASGFETTLVACLSLAAFAEACAPVDSLRTRRVGFLVGLTFLARMDGLLSASSAVLVVLHRIRDRRRLRDGAIVLLGTMAVLFVARLAYYGQLLPNTYYLKISGWPLRKRLPFGFAQNWPTIFVFVTGLLPFTVVAWRKLGPAARPVLFALVAPVLQLVYSTTNGGDFLAVFNGYDRYGATALPLLALGLSAVVLRANVRGAAAVAFSAGALLAGLTPVLWFGGTGTFRLWEPAPRDFLLLDSIYAARVLGVVTRPGARIATCPAGAPIYFSHRGGVDLLGKVEPYVAHLPARDRPPPEPRCWRGYVLPSGHNKEDVPGLFALRRPDVSYVRPPDGMLREYVSFTALGRPFFALRDSPLVNWNLVYDVKPIPETRRAPRRRHRGRGG